MFFHKKSLIMNKKSFTFVFVFLFQKVLTENEQVDQLETTNITVGDKSKTFSKFSSSKTTLCLLLQ